MLSLFIIIIFGASFGYVLYHYIKTILIPGSNSDFN